MTRRGSLGGHTARPGVIATTLVAALTIAFGPVGGSSFAVSASTTGTGIPRTEPGAAPAAPGPLLESPAPAADPTPVPDPTPDPTPAPADPTPTPDATPPAGDPTPTPAPVDPTPTPAPGDPTPTPDPSATPAPTLPAGVVGPGGGLVAFGPVSLDVPAQAVVSETRFSLSATGGPDYKGLPPAAAYTIRAREAVSGKDVASFNVPVILHFSEGALDLDGLAPPSVRIAEAKRNSWNVLPTASVEGDLTAMILSPGLYGVVGESAAPPVDMTIRTDAPADGRHRVDPGATVHVTLAGRADWPIAAGTITMDVPGDWTLEGAGGGTYDAATNTVTWDAADAGSAFSHTLTFTAPKVAAESAQYEYTGSFGARIVQKRSRVYRADAVSVLVAPKFVVQHKAVGEVNRKSRAAKYEPEDTDLKEAPRFTVIRVRYRIENPDSLPVAITPQLQYRDVAGADDPVAALASPFLVPGLAAAGTWVTLPGAGVEHGRSKFYVATESRDFRKESKPIDEGDARTREGGRGGQDQGGRAGVDGGMYAAAGRSFSRGVHSMGDNPAPTITIPADSWTEVEFSVRATGFADFDTTYDLRLTDGGAAIEPSVVASMAIGPNPDAGTVGSADTTGNPYRGSLTPAGAPYALVAATGSGTAGATGMRAAGLAAAAGVQAAAGPGSLVPSPHGDLSMTTDSCAACHRTHTGQNQWLATAPLPQSQQCFVCHNGLGATSNTQAQWATATANNASTASYYQHPSTAANSGHTNALDTEFAGVLNRHAECADCHNPHNPTDTTLLAASTGAGWLVSGATVRGSGVSVTNGAAAAAPSYGWLSSPPKDESGDIFPTPTGPLQYEYQLCFKCHAGYTKLIASTGSPMSSHPSWWSLDKGVELNPANKGVHPIESMGTNQTTQLGNSLTPLPGANTQYRIWRMTTTSVVRCSQCHGTPAQTPTGPNASSGVRLDTHVSPNRGILRANYRDRSLRLNGEPYVGTDFTLCFLCHSTEPFTADVGDRTDTNFEFHGYHMQEILDSGFGTSRDIDVPGAGGGTALCAECHFRTHSNAFKFGNYQAPATGYAADRLVNFSPNVLGAGAAGQIRWQRITTGTQRGGSCTLTCHGAGHINEQYRY